MSSLMLLLAFFLFAGAVFFGYFSYKMFTTNKHQFQANARLSKNFTNGLLGKVETWEDSQRRNMRTSSGMAINGNSFELRGKLSDEAIRRVTL